MWHCKGRTPKNIGQIQDKLFESIITTQNISIDIYMLGKIDLSVHTLQLKMFPKAEKVSYMALLSMDLSKFLMKTLPTPDFRREGSRWDHIIRMGRPFITSKFIVSRARSASAGCWKFTYA